MPYSSHAVILDRLGPGRGRPLLDVGAADGFLSELLTAQGWRVTALERDPAQAERARGRCAEVVVADLDEAAQTLSGPFDAIVYGDVLEHLSDPLAALVALNRALAAGGRRHRLGSQRRPPVGAPAAPRGALRVRRPRHPRPHPPALLHAPHASSRSWREAGPRGGGAGGRRRCRCPWSCPTRLHGAWLARRCTPRARRRRAGGRAASPTSSWRCAGRAPPAGVGLASPAGGTRRAP